MRRTLSISAKIAAAAATCLAVTIAVATPANASAAAPADLQPTAYFTGTGATVGAASGVAYLAAYYDGYFACVLHSESESSGASGTVYTIVVGCYPSNVV